MSAYDPQWRFHAPLRPSYQLYTEIFERVMMRRTQMGGRGPMSAKDWLPAAARAAAIDRKLKMGEALFRLGDNTIGLCEVIAGRVRLARVDRSGHEVVLHVAGAGEMLAEASLFSPQYRCDAIASTNSTVRVYPKREVLAAFEENPKAARAFSAALGRDLRVGINGVGPMGMHGQMQQGGMMGQMHSQMMQGQGGNMGQGMHGGMGGHGGMHGQQSGAVGVPTMSGQDAFGTIQEVVQILQADPATDWSKVNIGVLRQHLIDMNEVTMHAAAAERVLDNGIEIAVTGEGRTLEAIKRMLPPHVSELREIGWNAKSDELPTGVKLTVMASEAQPLTKLKALGFMGIMVQGSHHQSHHLMIAKGQFAMH